MKKLFFLLAFVICANTMAAEIIEHVLVGDLYYNIDTEKKTAEVTFESQEYQKNYPGLTDDLVIPASITYNEVEYGVIGIGWDAFRECNNLASIEIPNSVTYINSSAFSYCYDLTSIQLPSGITSIGYAAFWYCTSLTIVEIPATVTNIEEGAFFGCRNLMAINVDADNLNYCSIDGVLFNKSKTTLIQFPGGKRGPYTIPNGVTTIENDAFGECQNVGSIEIPYGVTSIGDNAFRSCYLESIIIPNSVTTIGYSAFEFTSLTSIDIPASVISLGNSVFRYCRSLTAINVDSNNQNYCSQDGVLYNKKRTILLKFPEEKEADFEIPSGVTTIGDEAFWNCWGLKSVVIPNSITTIGSENFRDCNNLISIDIPASVTSIGEMTFTECDSLKSINVASNNINYSSQDGVLFNRGMTEIIRCPGGKRGKYEIPNTITIIGDHAFYECPQLTSITIPISVTTIKESAFSLCYGLTSLFVPTTVTQIENWAFGDVYNVVYTGTAEGASWGARHLNMVVDGIFIYEDAERTILTGVTKDAHGDIVIPGNVVSIKEYAFEDFEDAGTATIIVPNTVKEIDEYAFSRVHNVIYHGSLEGAPWGARYLNLVIDGIWMYEGEDKQILVGITGDVQGDLIIPDNVTSIRPYALVGFIHNYDNRYATITVPSTVMEIGEGAFWDVFNVVYSGTAKGAPWGAKHMNLVFDGIFMYEDEAKTILVGVQHDAKGDIEIPDNVKIIRSKALANLDNKSNISIIVPNTVEEIGEDAFAYMYCVYYNGDATGAPWGAQNMNLFKEGWLTYTDNTKTKVMRCDAKATGKIELPNSVVTIGAGAFWGCESLDTIWIPSGVDTIEIEALLATQMVEKPIDDDYFVSNLKAIIVDPANQHFSSVDGVLYDKDVKTLIQYPLGRTDAYTIPSTVDSIAILAAYGSHISELSMPGSVKKIAEEAFMYCTTKTVHILEGVEEMPEMAFAACLRLEELSLPNSLKKIGRYAFSSCLNLRGLTLGSDLDDIGAESFTIDTAYCRSITCMAEQVPLVSGCKSCSERLPFMVYNRTWNEKRYWDANKIDPSNLIVYVPAQSVKAYKEDDAWGQYTIRAIGAVEVDVTEIQIEPSTNSVVIEWPTVVNATEYTIAISKNGEIVCRLTFNENGQLMNISFAAPNRKGISRNAPVALKTNTGWQYTITGLNSNTNYDVTITTKNSNGEVIKEETKSFKTIGVANTYTITFVNWDGKELLKLTDVAEGTIPEYTAATPTRPDDEDYTYSFAGWTPSIVAAIADATYTATFDATSKSSEEKTYFIVRFLDWDDTVLKKESVEKGHDATPPSNPTREGYEFIGWDEDYTNVQKDLTIYALYKKMDQALDQITNDQSPITNKIIKDNQLLILRGDKVYTVTGQEVK